MKNPRGTFLVTLSLCLFAAIAWADSAQAQSQPSPSPSPQGLLVVSNEEGPDPTVAARIVEKNQFAPENGEKCRGDIKASDGFKIRSVKVKMRYLPALPHPLPALGTGYSPVIVTAIVKDVHEVLTQEAQKESEEGETELKLLKTVSVNATPGAVVDFKMVTSCVTIIKESECKLRFGDSRCVDIAIHATSLRVNTSDPITNLLNIPRSNRPSFLSQVPGSLRAFSPKFGFSSDRAFGPSGAFEIATNLLDLARNFSSQPLKANRNRLDLEATGLRALNGSYYETTSKIAFSRSVSKTIDSIALEAGFNADHIPLGANQYLKSAVTFGAGIKLRTSFGPLADIAARARYRWSNNRFNGGTTLPSEFTKENALEASAFFDGRLLQGVNRLAIWVDANSPSDGRNNYYRAAALWGYQREFIIVPNQTVGVELLLGGGRAWGVVPQYARFYGGNSSKNFLYESKDSPVISSFPTGPLLRSFGSGQATARTGLLPAGGTSYWNLNLNVTIPIPKWSSPLVPDISLEVPKKDANGKPVLTPDKEDAVMEERPLRVILKNQGETSRKVLVRTFLKQGMNQSEADAKAQRELRSINSILGFIADQANIYSLKPLFMFDVAHMNAPGATNNQNRYAVGGGMQFTIVIAKFEAGYMRTLQPLAGDNKGNFFMRLFFQNLY